VRNSLLQIHIAHTHRFHIHTDHHGWWRRRRQRSIVVVVVLMWGGGIQPFPFGESCVLVVSNMETAACAMPTILVGNWTSAFDGQGASSGVCTPCSGIWSNLQVHSHMPMCVYGCVCMRVFLSSLVGHLSLSLVGFLACCLQLAPECKNLTNLDLGSDEH
jgi:hypothetical protein